MTLGREGTRGSGSIEVGKAVRVVLTVLLTIIIAKLKLVVDSMARHNLI